MEFKLKIVTPKGIYKDTEVEILNVTTTNGNIGILAHHMPLASGIEISEMSYVEKGVRKTFAISGGFVYVGDTETTVIANAIESPEEIDEARALEAKARAEGHLKESDADLVRAEIALKRAINRLHVKSI